MRTGKFGFCLLAKGIIPDYPVPHDKPQFIANDFYVCGIIVTDCDIERTVWLKNLLAGCHPVFGPCDVVLAFDLVVVFVVLVAYIEWRISENQVRKGILNLRENLDAIAAYYSIYKFWHGNIVVKGIKAARVIVGEAGIQQRAFRTICI